MSSHWFLLFIILFSPVTTNTDFPSKPVFETSSKIWRNNLILHEGEKVSLSCQSTGNPAPKVTLLWINTTDTNYYHQNTSVDKMKDSTITNLFFTASRRQHNWKIQCVVTTEEGQDRWMAEDFLLLQVYYLDNLTAYVIPSSVVSGDRVALVCEGNGQPAVNRTWMKNGSPLEKEAKELVVLNNVSSKDTGTYICTMWNIIGKKSAAVNLHVEEEEIKVTPVPSAIPGDVTATPVINAILVFSVLISLLLFILLVLTIHYIHRSTIPCNSRNSKRRLPNLPLPTLSRSAEDRVHPQLTVKVTQSTKRSSTGNPAAAQGEGHLPTRCKSSKLPNVPVNSKLTCEHPYVNTSTTHGDYLELVDENSSEPKSAEDLLYEEPGESCFRPTEPSRKSSSITLLA